MQKGFKSLIIDLPTNKTRLNEIIKGRMHLRGYNPRDETHLNVVGVLI